MLFGVLQFSTSKILHINTVILFPLTGFMGAIYWLLPGELGRELKGIVLAELLFWVFCAVVAGVFLFI